jgi:hypothetical protein
MFFMSCAWFCLRCTVLSAPRFWSSSRSTVLFIFGIRDDTAFSSVFCGLQSDFTSTCVVTSVMTLHLPVS